jgi:hypothetical protein
VGLVVVVEEVVAVLLQLQMAPAMEMEKEMVLRPEMELTLSS